MAAMLFSAVLTSGGAANAVDCDPAIDPITEPSELAYQDRGTYCEGLYVQPVSVTGLQVVGVHGSAVDIAPDANVATFHVRAGGTKKLRIVSTRPRQYYRMDANFSGEQFSLPLDIARHPELRMRSSEFAVTACVAQCSSLMPTYVPTTFGRAVDKGSAPVIILQATEDLLGLHVLIRDRGDDRILLDQEFLSDTVWRAWRPAVLPLRTKMVEADEIVVEVTARGRFEGQFETVSAIVRNSQ